MTRRYAAYLLRHWRQTDGRELVEVQHIATGERHRFPSLADACAWLQGSGQALAPPVESPTSRAPPGRDPSPPVPD